MKKFCFSLLFLFCSFSLMASVVYTDNQWHVNKLGYASNNNKMIPYPSAFRVRMTQSAMEVDFKIEGDHWKDFQKNPFVRKNAVWPAEESVELFFDPGRSCSKYLQFAAGVNGNLFDKRFEKKPKAWNVSWKVTRQDFKGGVIFKFVIPFDRSFPKPAEGDIWGFNACRNVVINGTLTNSTFAKVGHLFNNPSKFAELRIGTKESFLAANQKKNLKQLAVLEKEIRAAGVYPYFAAEIAALKKNCDESELTFMKDEFQLIRLMKGIK